MPRRQATKEVPRWRRGQHQSSGPSVRLSPKREKALVAKLAAQAGLPAPATAASATPTAPGVNKALAATGAYRFRRHLVPFWWLGGVLATGAAAHAAHAVPLGVILGLGSAAGIWLLTRHLPDFTRRAAQAMAILTALWVPALSLAGFARPWPPFLLACWLCVLVPWVRHYRIRQEGAKPPERLVTTDYEIWAKLAAKRKWAGNLGMRTEVPGGISYPIALVGAETHIGQVISEASSIAAAWDKPVTEAYVERSPDGVESRGTLTILKASTLTDGRFWDGKGIDRETGIAVVGRFPDGHDARFQHFSRMDGVYHEIVAGVTGSGKSTLLDLGLCTAAVSGFVVPIILDPQEGQSFEGVWRERLISASGAEECMLKLRGIQAGMLARSYELARMWWTDPDGDRHKGMTFFDPFLSSLPIVEVTLDEAPALLVSEGKPDAKRAELAVKLTADTAKRGRKAGVRLRLVAGVPSLDELGGSRSLRSYLRGCNVACLRTDDPGDAAFLGIAANPAQIPQFFRDGSRTQGLGYVKGPDNRPGTPMRTDAVTKEARAAAAASPLPELDEPFAEAMERGMKDSADATPLPPPAGARVATGTPLAAVPALADDEPAPGGRTAADAILAILAAEGGELERAEIMLRAARLVVEEWGRAKPFTPRATTGAFAKLAEEGRIINTRHGHYAPLRTSLHAVQGNDHTPSVATGG